MHVGGWVQFDNIWWDQSAKLINAQGKPGTPAGKSPPIASGVGSGGIASLEDGAYFRRIRLQANGTFLGELRIQPDAVLLEKHAV